MKKLLLLITLAISIASCTEAQEEKPTRLDSLNLKYYRCKHVLTEKNSELDSLINEYKDGFAAGVYSQSDSLSKVKRNNIVTCNDQASEMLDRLHVIFDEIEKVSGLE